MFDTGYTLEGLPRSNVSPEGYDLTLVLVVAALLCLGSLMVYSASISLADSTKYHTTYTHFLIRHLISMGIALGVGGLALFIPMRVWRRLSPAIIIIAILLLIAVLIPGIGRSVNGARRWIGLGFMNLQVSEVAKFAALLGASWFTVSRQDYMHSLRKGFAPMALCLGFGAALISMQPDLGATMVTISITMGVLFLGGLNLWIFIFVIIAVVIFGVLAVILTPWRVGRVMAYLNPWDAENALGKAYQLSHSLIAFGRGEWSGVGLGASVEKLHYLPEAHTDFILAVIGEELGFVGVCVVLILFYTFIRKAFAIGRQAIKLDQIYSGLVAEGIGIWVGVQVIINGGVATGLFPTKGLTLPFVSYGGSSLLATITAVALLLRVDRENRILMRGGSV
ncbi:MAG TPA: putative lipid II flippase FtsW [Sutterella sp.]|nr:putative lipid II flippase FtsW [Sutterella sp.]